MAGQKVLATCAATAREARQNSLTGIKAA